ncbi:5-oxoprolinase subunit PxpA [soil metagenome]
MLIDLNADLGEGAGTDAELLHYITSANVSCGFHAGDPDTARTTLELAVAAGVKIGAHPGYADREHFGRREQTLTDRQVASLVFHQVGALTALTRLCRADLMYVKPHGALYHQACRDRTYARPLVAVAFLNNFSMVGLPDSVLKEACEHVAVPFIAEGFVDRRYNADGTLVARSEPNALIHDVNEAVEQAEMLVRTRSIRTLCVHGDTPGAVDFAAKVKEALTVRGFVVKAFA